MTHKTTPLTSAEDAKLAAHAIKQRLESLAHPIKLNHAYEALAIAHKHPNWATMKASFASETHSTPTTTSAQRFHLGCYKDVGAVDISTEEALAHFHVFGLSPIARRRLLSNLAGNAIENGSSAIFIEPITIEGIKSPLIQQMMDSARMAGRAGDFRVIDVSSATTRVGDSFNILSDARDADRVADLLMAANYSTRGYSRHHDQRKILVSVIARAMSDLRPAYAPLTIENILESLTQMEEKDPPPGTPEGVPIDETHAAIIRTNLIRIRKEFGRYFNSTTDWEGPWQSAKNGDILLVFTGGPKDGLEFELEQFVIASLKRGIRCIRRSETSYPHMLLCNDVDGFSEDADIIKEASWNGVSLVLADQCPTPPRSLNHGAIRFRTDWQEITGWADHQLLRDGGNSALTFDRWTPPSNK